MSAVPAITVDHVTKRFRLYHERNQSLKAAILRGGRARYDEFFALRDVSLEIPVGATLGLIGENGSGKSTLLKCIAQILSPDYGSISTRGKVSALLELGAGFHPELSGRENVYLNGAILGLSSRQIDQRFDDIVGFAGIEQFIDSPVKNYSSGMYVRLGFSVAISVDPEILLVDEVLAVGDAEFQQRCTEKILELKHGGRTIVVVSHSMESVRNICDTVALLEHGGLVTVGPAVDVIDEYLVDVFHDREFDPAGGARWGSGEIRIDTVELLGPDDRPLDHVRTGDRITVRMHYSAAEPVEKPVFGIGITAADGAYVAGPNTRDSGLVFDTVSGEGHIDLTINRLMLVPGIYDVTVAVHDETCTHPFDFRSKLMPISVELGTPREILGYAALDTTWDTASVHTDGRSPESDEE
ncbi:MAG: ABC transporter ATP-binding protein [Acidimicrobiia bacterium]